MNLVLLMAGKGSPGVTTAAVALGAIWPRRVLLAECDAGGGDLIYRYRSASGAALAQGRGVVSLATALRSDSYAGLAWTHAQEIAGGLPVLVGPASPAQVSSIGYSWQKLAASLAAVAEGDVLVDCGRLVADAPALRFMPYASLVVMLTRPTAEGAAHLASALRGLSAHLAGAAPSPSRPDLPFAQSPAGVPVRVVVVADRGRGPVQVKEVSDALVAEGTPTEVAGYLEFDPTGEGGLRGKPTRHLDRSPLISSARNLASTLDRWLPSPPVQQDEASAPELPAVASEGA